MPDTRIKKNCLSARMYFSPLSYHVYIDRAVKEVFHGIAYVGPVHRSLPQTSVRRCRIAVEWRTAQYSLSSFGWLPKTLDAI